MTTWSCPCEFDAHTATPMFSPDWYRAHRDHHLAVFPDVDQGTRDNLDMFVSIAERRS